MIDNLGVVIPTYNRPTFLERALQSVARQTPSASEIIVVDDASQDDSAAKVCAKFPNVKYIRQPTNMGPGPARNRGIRESRCDWILLLDDDDTLDEGALCKLTDIISKSGSYLSRFPVIQFPVSNAKLRTKSPIVYLKDYLSGNIVGDFTPIINRSVFISKGLAFPEIRIGGESLLWWRIARDFGIPTFPAQLVTLHDDAPLRMTSVHHQIARAQEYAEFQAKVLEQFGQELRRVAPSLYEKKILGRVTYLLLANSKYKARSEVHRFKDEIGLSWRLLALYILSFAPPDVIRYIFIRFRGRVKA